MKWGFLRSFIETILGKLYYLSEGGGAQIRDIFQKCSEEFF